MTTQATINKGDMFVGSWGYDQTQYSIYRVVEAKGQFVTVEGTNGWSRFDNNDLAVGSTVKLYEYTAWDDMTDAERKDFEGRGFNRWNYNDWKRGEAEKVAEVRMIVKAGRVDGNRYSYLWELDNGQIVNSTDDWKTRPQIKIIHGLTRRKVSISKYDGQPRITIDQSITAHLDQDFGRNANKYEEQNEYTAYNGR
jgi:hypothetical protein